MRHDKYLRLAEVQAQRSRYERWPMGAVLARGGRIIAAAPNSLRNEPSMAGLPLEKCSIHAEAAVLRQVNRAGGTMYVARLTRGGTRALARPCRRCRKLLVEAGVRSVVWTIDPHSWGFTDLKDMEV